MIASVSRSVGAEAAHPLCEMRSPSRQSVCARVLGKTLRRTRSSWRVVKLV